MKLPDEALRRDAWKFVQYGLERRSFTPLFDGPAPGPQALAAARAVRQAHGPAILLHGVMPRSGTVYVGELLRLHPDLYAFPNHVWEFPFLQQTPRLLALQAEFLWSYEQNMDKVGAHDFLPLFGAALLAYLEQAAPPGKRILLKVPSVQHLDYFYHVFPHEQLLMLTRDGRDVVHSTLKTWPQLRFAMVCLRWRRAAQMVLACHARYAPRDAGYWLGRFEDALRDPESFVRAACARFGLDPGRYPFDRMRQIPVHGSSTTKQAGKVTWNPVAKQRGFNPIGRWQQWPAHRKWLFKRLAGRQLIDLGYAEDQRW